jgi:Tfp pilus assembly protein PilN
VVRQADALERSRDLSHAFGTALAATEARIAAAVGQGPSWPAWMAEFAQMASESIHIDAHQASRGQDGFRVELNGSARSAGGASARDELTRFIDRLKASPLVAAVDLGATRRTDAEGVEEQRFTVTLTLTPLPRALAAAKEGPP